ncbi:MAG TPA: hypothetical protein VFE58_01535 [Tepidisphaeraceae bacterium]|jgi:hypothetical protein|nr:hypothetical protein [Tepidisphaeraceae bacterium]
MRAYLQLIAALTLSATVAFAADAPVKKHHPSTRPSTQAAVTPYPLKTCIVSGEEFGGDMGDPVILTYEGREMKFCCSSCVKKFKKDPAKYIKALDEKAKQPATPAPAK